MPAVHFIAAFLRFALCPPRRIPVVLFSALAILVSAARAQDWPQFLGPTRDGVYTGPPLAGSWPKEGPVPVWSKKVGVGYSGPVVAGGKLILFHQLGSQETVECLDAANGQSVWSNGYATGYQDDMGRGDGPRATPAIRENKVFTLGAEGMLNAWNLADGKRIWKVDTRTEFAPRKGFFGVACSPLAEGNLILLNIGGKGGAGIVAFEQASGRVVWNATDHEASYSSPIAASIGGERFVLAITRGSLTALQPADGKVLFDYAWRPPMSASVSAATPLVIGDLIFISASYGTGAMLLRFKKTGPEKLWSGDDILSNHYATSLHHDGYLYGFDGRQEEGCNLRCVELKTGKVRWSQDRFGAGTATLANDHLLILTEKGELLRAPATPMEFKPSARAQILPFGTRAYPALANGFLYARSDSKLVCLDLRKP